jgi:hypothetical protein
VQLEELNSKLYGYLPQALQEHCQVGSFNRGCLVIVVTDSVWASQLRYSIPELRDKLRSEAGIYQLSSIKVTIASIEEIHSTKRPPAALLSPKAREAIIAGGEQCEYLPLKKALQKLGEPKKN